ncbi:MAG: autotransporter outer rane beta-barrel protein [Xanthobacteraceae bacterium]|nr:autotransporter outer rane beta-barrel protein [Xanthobacteraceae bacterium]
MRSYWWDRHMVSGNIGRKRQFRLLDFSARLLCGVALVALAAAPARAEDGTLRILTLNIWNQFKQTPGVTADFMINGNFDVLAFQEVNSSRYVTDIPGILQNAGLGTYGGIQIGDVGVISRLPGTFGTYTSPGLSTQGRFVSYTVANADGGRPETVIGSVHLDYSDTPNRRMAEARALNTWAKGADTPIILVGDFNGGDVSERGLHSISQQELLLRIYTKNPSNSFYYNLLRQYATDDVALDKFIADWKGKGSSAIDSATIPSGLFADETYPIEGNTPQTMNILKKQYMLLQTDRDREDFEPHELNDGSTTWPSAGEDDTNTWGSWHRVKIDHFLASRPFGKWYTIVDDSDDPYSGVIKDVYVTKPDGTKVPISDHEPVAHTLKWIGPALETYTETVDNKTVEKTRLVWGADATVFEEKNKEFYLTRNNMRTDVYLGQISDEDGKPSLTDLTEAEKKTLLDCKSTDPRLQQAIVEYCIDDHSFIGETLVTDGGTVIVDEDAALGTSAASLHLNNGTLRIAGTSMAVLDRAVVLEAGGGAIEVAEGANAVAIARVISGEGSLTKLGEGALGLFGTNTYTGGTVVKDGLLVVNGSIATSSLTTVLDGAALAGTGTVGNLKIASGGTIAPGSSIGTLNVAGDLTFASGSAYEVEVNAEGKSDLIAVTGKTTIEGGTVMSIGADGDYRPETSYTIINSAGGVEGEFGEVTSNFAFLDPTLAYGATNVVLTLERNDTAFDKVGSTFNQRSAARGAESLGYGTPLYDAIVMLDEDTARSTFAQIGGDVHASTYGVLIDNSRFLRDAVNERLRSAAGERAGEDISVLSYDKAGPQPVAADTDGFAVWGQSFGSWAEVDSDGNASGLSSNVGGLFAGADAAVGDSWRVGLLAGYSQTSVDLDDLASNGDSDNLHLGFYAGSRSGPFAVRLGAGYTWHSIDTSRHLVIPEFNEKLSSDYDASTTQVFGEVAYRFEMAKAALEPFLSLAYVHFSNDGFSEDGGATALDGSSGDLDTLFTTLGARASTSFDIGATVATLHGTLGWQHASGDVVPESVLAFAGGEDFAIRGAPIAEDVAIVRAGLDFAATPNATLGVSYSGQFGSGLGDNGVTGRLSIRF